jgi:hypothetical protein
VRQPQSQCADRAGEVFTPQGAHAVFDSSARYFDLFEHQPDGTLLWHEAILGLAPARLRLAELDGQARKKVVLMDLYRDKIIE